MDGAFTTQATLRSHYTSFRSGHITRDKRKIARLAIFPNFLRYAPKTSFIPDVIGNNWATFGDKTKNEDNFFSTFFS